MFTRVLVKSNPLCTRIRRKFQLKRFLRHKNFRFPIDVLQSLSESSKSQATLDVNCEAIFMKCERWATDNKQFVTNSSGWPLLNRVKLIARG